MSPGKLLSDLPSKNKGNLQNQAGCMMGIFQMLHRRRFLPRRHESQPTPETNPGPQFGDIVDSPRPPRAAMREAARSSLDSHRKVLALRLHDLPRWSLDSKQANMRRLGVDPGSNSAPRSNLESRSYSLMEDLAAIDLRPAGVVAKLMGLAELPASNSLPNSPSLQCAVAAEKLSKKDIAISASSRVSPWKERKQLQEPRKSEAERKRQPNKELRKLERILQTIRAKRIHEPMTRGRSESPIVIMKPVTSTRVTSSLPKTAPFAGLPPIRRIRTAGIATEKVGNQAQLPHLPQSSPRSPGLTKENGTVSPRLGQMRHLDREKKAESAEPKSQQSTVRRGTAINDQSGSPRALTPPSKKMAAAAAAVAQQQQQQRQRRERKDEWLREMSMNRIRAEVNAHFPSSPGRRCTELASILIGLDKNSHDSTKTEHPSPISVLDSSFYRDDYPRTSTRVRRLVREEEASQSDPAEFRVILKQKPTLKNADHPLQKPWQPTVSKYDDDPDEENGDGDDDDRGNEAKPAAVMVEMANPRHHYVYEILQASGIMGTGSDDQALTRQSNKPDPPVDPCVFLLLEKSKGSTSKEEKLHRRLLFDAINETLTKKMELTRSLHGTQIWEHLLKELCREIDRLSARSDGGTAGDDALKSAICKHLTQQSEEWASFGKEASTVVLDIERTLFRDLVNDIVNSELSMALNGSARFRLQNRRMLFR
ncbi:uncharacterized protein LOC144702127 [Wolffia australiana]